MRGLILGLFALSSVAVLGKLKTIIHENKISITQITFLVQSKPQFGGGGGFAGGLGAPENLRDPEIK